MRVSLVLLAFAAVSSVGSAFAPLRSYNDIHQTTTALKMGYVPDGMTPAQWKAKQAKENADKAKKDFGAFGPKSFKSRSLQSFHKDLEKGKAGHLMPMFNAKEKMKKGVIKQEDIPYMQRGGAWDNSDVKGAKKMSWNKEDKKYVANPRNKGVDWTGGRQRSSPAANRANVKQAQEQKKKGGWNLFG